MQVPTPARLRSLIAALENGLLEREAAARLALLAALAGEHVLLIGPPGTAKSELARRLQRSFAGARYFERLLTRFSTPEELFGPLSLRALEDDRYERLVDGFLPTAGIAFLDEVFQANSAILNALLTLLNEREFDNGPDRLRTPLVSVVAASNEVPVDDALHAFFDRFLVRVPVAPVSDASFGALLALAPAAALAVGEPITVHERSVVGAAAAQVALGDAALRACTKLRGWLAGQGVAVSDRRWRQWIALMRTAAATEGRSEVDAMDLWLAPYVASPAPEWAPRIAQWFEAELLQAVPRDAPWLTRAVEAFEKQLEVEQSAPPEDDGGDEGGTGKLGLARAIGRGETGETGASMPRIVSERLEARSRRRYSPVHVAARTAQVDAVLAQSRAARQTHDAEREQLLTALAPRLWVPPALGQRWLSAHDRTLQVLDTLVARLENARAGYAALTLDGAAPAVAPAPVDVATSDG